MAEPDSEAGFQGLIGYIQESRGIDFHMYKRTSLRRRILLRLETLRLDTFADYHAFLEAHPQEFVDLLNTVLINVTAFFRDPDAWEALKAAVLPRLIAPERGREQLRVWSVGCASGEEPYTLAILLCEMLGPADYARRVKIYATDLDEAALSAARQASYLPRDVQALPEPLLRRYFERTNDHYVVARDVRKAVIVGRHNVVTDAPISRIDLLVCRNLLIYLETETQNRVLPRLHYALVDDGCLFLGNAETQLGRSKLFEPIDMKHRLFRKVPQPWRRSGTGPLLPGHGAAVNQGSPHTQLQQAIVDRTGAAYLVIGRDDVLTFASAAARRMLEVGDSDVGRPFRDLAVSYRPIELRSQIDEVRRLMRPIRIEHQEYLRPPNEPVRLTIELAPLSAREGGGPSAILLSFTDTTHTFTLQQELEAAQQSLETTIEELQSANEELETTNEELQSTNEELETTNEELQSTNEELETTNEELRSANEELEATNDELRRHSDEFAEYRRHTDAVLRGLDAGVVVVNAALTVIAWNRWSENAWGLREEEAIDQPFGALDIGLPVRQVEPALTRAVRDGTPSETTLDAVDRRGRAMQCRVRVSPLLYDDRSTQGAVIVLEDRSPAHVR